MGDDSTRKKVVMKVHIYVNCNCVVRYRLSYQMKGIQVNVELTLSVFRCNDDECVCSELTPSFRQIRGEARRGLKAKMTDKSQSQVYSQSVSEANEDVAQGGYLPDIASHDVLNKIRQEIRDEKQLDNNIFVDLQLRAESGRLPDLIELRTYPKFTATFIFKGALELLSNFCNTSNIKTLLLDATGGITRKIPKSKSARPRRV